MATKADCQSVDNIRAHMAAPATKQVMGLAYLLLAEFQRQAGGCVPTAKQIRDLAEALVAEGVEFGEVGLAAAVIGWNVARGS